MTVYVVTRRYGCEQYAPIVCKGLSQAREAMEEDIAKQIEYWAEADGEEADSYEYDIDDYEAYAEDSRGDYFRYEVFVTEIREE